MEAATLCRKKKTLHKSSLKKSIKNVLCRPDPLFWPVLSNEQGNHIIELIQKFQIAKPQFPKMHWSELKLIPKEMRPKEKYHNKVEGLIFGIVTCTKSIEAKNCISVIVDADIPQILIQNVVDAAQKFKIPMVCVKNLRKTCKEVFGFNTCCLGLTNNELLEELRLKLNEYAKSFEMSNKDLDNNQNVEDKVSEHLMEHLNKDVEVSKHVMQDDEHVQKANLTPFTYLYRKTKATRVFVPPSKTSDCKNTSKTLIGKDFIKLDKSQTSPQVNKNNLYKKMIVKRISNNPNRKK